MRCLIALILIFAVGFSLSSAYAQVQFPNFHQGISFNSDARNTVSHLNWIVNYQDGTETGTTNDVFGRLVIDTSLSFAPQDNPARTIIDAEVYGETDHLNIGTKYCYQEPNWNFEQVIIRNGIEYDFAKQFSGRTADFDDTSQRSTSSVLPFPSFSSQLVNGLFSPHQSQSRGECTSKAPILFLLY